MNGLFENLDQHRSASVVSLSVPNSTRAAVQAQKTNSVFSMISSVVRKYLEVMALVSIAASSQVSALQALGSLIMFFKVGGG